MRWAAPFFALSCVGGALAQGFPSDALVISGAIGLARQGKYLDAERTLKDLAGREPGSAEAQAALGQLYYRFGYYDASLQPLTRAIELRPEDKASRLSRAISEFKTGAVQDAVKSTKELLAEDPPPRDIDLSLTYAQYLYENGEMDEALAQTRAAVGFAPQHPIGYFWLARLLLAKNQVTEAAVAAERSVALAPELPFARNLLVRLYRLEGRVADSDRQAEWLRTYEARKARR